MTPVGCVKGKVRVGKVQVSGVRCRVSGVRDYSATCLSPEIWPLAFPRLLPTTYHLPDQHPLFSITFPHFERNYICFQ